MSHRQMILGGWTRVPRKIPSRSDFHGGHRGLTGGIDRTHWRTLKTHWKTDLTNWRSDSLEDRETSLERA
jgi:hypothetical protein